MDYSRLDFARCVIDLQRAQGDAEVAATHVGQCAIRRNEAASLRVRAVAACRQSQRQLAQHRASAQRAFHLNQKAKLSVTHAQSVHLAREAEARALEDSMATFEVPNGGFAAAPWRCTAYRQLEARFAAAVLAADEASTALVAAQADVQQRADAWAEAESGWQAAAHARDALYASFAAKHSVLTAASTSARDARSTLAEQREVLKQAELGLAQQRQAQQTHLQKRGRELVADTGKSVKAQKASGDGGAQAPSSLGCGGAQAPSSLGHGAALPHASAHPVQSPGLGAGLEQADAPAVGADIEPVAAPEVPSTPQRLMEHAPASACTPVAARAQAGSQATTPAAQAAPCLGQARRTPDGLHAYSDFIAQTESRVVSAAELLQRHGAHSLTLHNVRVQVCVTDRNGPHFRSAFAGKVGIGCVQELCSAFGKDYRSFVPDDEAQSDDANRCYLRDCLGLAVADLAVALKEVHYDCAFTTHQNIAPDGNLWEEGELDPVFRHPDSLAHIFEIVPLSHFRHVVLTTPPSVAAAHYKLARLQFFECREALRRELEARAAEYLAGRRVFVVREKLHAGDIVVDNDDASPMAALTRVYIAPKRSVGTGRRQLPSAFVRDACQHRQADWRTMVEVDVPCLSQRTSLPGRDDARRAPLAIDVLGNIGVSLVDTGPGTPLALAADEQSVGEVLLGQRAFESLLSPSDMHNRRNLLAKLAGLGYPVEGQQDAQLQMLLKAPY